MNDTLSPLSEAELAALIEETELCGTVSPPPELEEAVWRRLEEAERRKRLAPRRKKRTPAEELRRYRLQVAASVAAAVLLLFTLPSWEELRPSGTGRDAACGVEEQQIPEITEHFFNRNGGQP